MIDFLRGSITPKDILIVGVTVALAAVLCTVFFFFVVQPKQETLDLAKTELDVLQINFRKAKDIEANIDELRREAAKWAELVQTFEERLPEEREIPRLLAQFEALGNEIGLRVKLSQLPTTSDKNKETIPYEVTAQGTFHDIVTFINLLERDQRYLKISDLDIQEEEAGASEAVFTLSTFRFIQSEPAESST